jgi:hypothetical protein
VVLQLSISAVGAVHVHNLVLVVRISAFNDNSSKLTSLQTPCVNPEAIVFDHKATLRIVAIDHCASFVLFEAFLEFIPNLTNRSTFSRWSRPRKTYLHPACTFSVLTRYTIFDGSHVHHHEGVLFLQSNIWCHASMDNDHFTQRP